MKIKKRIIALIISIVIILASLPMTAMASPAADLPANMLDSSILRALEYTGYDVQAQKNDGTLYQSGSYGKNVPEHILSGIGYGTSLTGRETIVDRSTYTGIAPDLAKFRQYGLCCAGFVTYYISNYLPNIEGANTQFITDAINATAMNTQAVITWERALNNLAASGQIEKIGTSPTNVDRTKLAPGDLVIFGDETESHVHIGVYSGTYNGRDFMIHVGDDDGPEIMPIDWMSNTANGAKASYPNAYFHLPSSATGGMGTIEVYKTDPNGKPLAGASFYAVNRDTALGHSIGPTDNNGYAYNDTIPYGNYSISEYVFPEGYKENLSKCWNVTVDANTPRITLNVVNEPITGKIKINKTAEDGRHEGIVFKITGNGVDTTVTIGKDGYATSEELIPGTYTVTEVAQDKYIPNDSWQVTVVGDQTVTLNVTNGLKRGDVKVVKTTEYGSVEGLKFKLSGVSLSGDEVVLTATTDKNGIAYFRDVLITGHSPYILEEIDTPEKYVVPEKQNVTVEWNKVTEKSVYNELKRGDLKVIKTSEDNLVQGIRFILYGPSLSGFTVHEYATVGQDGTAVFKDIPIGENYIIEEDYVPIKYVMPFALQAVKRNESLIMVDPKAEF